MATDLRRTTSVMTGGAAVAVAIGVMNVATYAATVLGARLLGPQAYGGLAAIMGLLLVLGVVMLGLQTTGARRIASDPEHVAEIEHSLMRVTYRAALVLSLLALALAPLFQRVLHLDRILTAACVALVTWPMTVIGGQLGVLQGERRWLPLAAVYLTAGIGRLLGMMLLFVEPDQTVATLGLALGFSAPAVIGWVMLRRSATYRSAARFSGSHGQGHILREVASNSHALLAFLALSNADVILARVVLDGHSSGLYAGGLILAKSLLFLPQFVIVVAFPSMATASARRATLMASLGVVLVLGAMGVVAAWALSGLALVFVGGAEYAAIEDQLWLFAVLGTVLSSIQMLVYAVVARQSRRAVYLIWATLGALCLVVSRADNATRMVLIVMVVDGLLLVLLLAVSFWRLAGDQTAPPGPEVPTDPSVGGGVPAGTGADRDVEGDGQLGR